MYTRDCTQGVSTRADQWDLGPHDSPTEKEARVSTMRRTRTCSGRRDEDTGALLVDKGWLERGRWRAVAAACVRDGEKGVGGGGFDRGDGWEASRGLEE